MRILWTLLFSCLIALPSAVAEKRRPDPKAELAVLRQKLGMLDQEYAVERDRLLRYLGYMDQTLGIQVVEGAMTSAQAAEWLQEKRTHLFQNSYTDQELDHVFQQWRQAALGFLERVGQRAASTTTWPAGTSATLAATHLRINSEAIPTRPSNNPFADATILTAVEEVRNWTLGQKQVGTTTEAKNYFSGSEQRVSSLVEASHRAALGLSPIAGELPREISGATLEQAVAMLYENKLAEALSAFRALAAANPGDDEILRLWVLSELVTNGDIAAARRSADQLAARHPGEAQYLFLQGQCALFAHDTAAAAQWLSAGAQADPQLVQGIYQQANDMLTKGVTAVAYVQFSSLVWMQPPYAPAYFGLGFAAKAQGYRDVAIQAFERYLQFDPASTFSEQARSELQTLQGL